MTYTSLIFEKSSPERQGYQFPRLDVEALDINQILPKSLQRTSTPILPEVSEVEVVRHYSNLSLKCFSVDTGSYPLGSCTMKYNPKINEDAAALPGFTELHPLQSVDTIQGILKLQYELIDRLSKMTGMKWGTLQPFAGAHGEYTGMKFFKSYFDKMGDTKRKRILVPTASHGTNPASAHMAGFDVVEVAANENGQVSLADLEQYLDDELAGIMLTNPNTLGIFEEDILQVSHKIHDAGGLLYYDGANFNAIMGKTRPGDMGFDVIHLNLHKTFATPHGGGGPGAGPVLVAERLVPFIPQPDITFDGVSYDLSYDNPDSMGRVSGFFGNIGVLIRAYTYVIVMGCNGLQEASEHAVLFANYLRVALKEDYLLPYDTICKHEFVISASEIKEKYGISAMDIAKGLLDEGIHPPTMYFPLIVPEALMIEPTETESLAELDHFIEVMKALAKKAADDPQSLHEAPINTPIGRVDEVLAARKPKVRWCPQEN